ncbi:MAG TPA: hypothetical protein EYN64_02370 [Flavobacteriales bacterium]|nr:hypothetical protein [Flavobacteriales bacterium]
MDSYSVLHSAFGVTGGGNTSYTVPVAANKTVGGAEVAPLAVSTHTQTLVTRVFVCNTNVTNTGEFDITVSNFAASPAVPVVTTLYKAVSLSPKMTVEFGMNLTLKAGDILKLTFAASSGVFDVTIFGIEMITGGGPHA